MYRMVPSRKGGMTHASRDSREHTVVWRGACAVSGARQLCWDRVNASKVTPGAREVAAKVTEERSLIEASPPNQHEGLELTRTAVAQRFDQCIGRRLRCATARISILASANTL